MHINGGTVLIVWAWARYVFGRRLIYCITFHIVIVLCMFAEIISIAVRKFVSMWVIEGMCVCVCDFSSLTAM